MPARRVPCLRVLLPVLLFAASGVQQAGAGVFDDEEARRQINNLTARMNDRLDTSSKAQFELANQIQALREENARLRGQVETLTYELDAAKKRQQDFYIDLDGRLRKFEAPPQAETRPSEDGKTVAPKPAAAADPGAESRDYEAALNLFKANKLKESASAFEAFTKAYPDSALAPSAQYWLGNAHYALHDCKKAIDAQKALLNKWSGHAKAPDAMINISTCQQEIGDAKASKATLETVLIKYPDSPAAAIAKQRLKKK
ncbi:MAG: tol-pal system protein YbgF [Betaproteobacteria bacterium]|nr:tol-pal system protein YbgF [Betaproteobacteria bacterium]